MMILAIVLLSALPLPKTGSCPAGYSESGGYCAPMRSGERPAIPKRGACPSGWTSEAYYCLGPRR